MRNPETLEDGGSPMGTLLQEESTFSKSDNLPRRSPVVVDVVELRTTLILKASNATEETTLEPSVPEPLNFLPLQYTKSLISSSTIRPTRKQVLKG